MRKRPSQGPAGSGHLPAAPCPAAPRGGLLEEWPLSTSPSFCIVAHLQEGAVFGGRLGCRQPPLTMGLGPGRGVCRPLWASVSLSPQGLSGATPALGRRRRARSAGWRATSPRLVPWPRSPGWRLGPGGGVLTPQKVVPQRVRGGGGGWPRYPRRRHSCLHTPRFHVSVDRRHVQA